MGAFPATVASRATAIAIASWDQLRRELDKYSAQSYSWAFRGLQSDQWLLRTSLERLDVAPLCEAERYLVSAFQRRAHHHVSDPPPCEDELEWLALMQHHGAPARLLDSIKSPYVALFFAVRDATDSAGSCAVWGIDLDWCKNQALARINQRASANPVFDPPVQPEESLGRPGLFGQRICGLHIGERALQRPSTKTPGPGDRFRNVPALTLVACLFAHPFWTRNPIARRALRPIERS